MFRDPQRVERAVADGFAPGPVLVVGDLMLDRYVRGDAGHISPEAPVPVVRVAGERGSPGGAANVALNLAGLGIETALAGVIGDDGEGRELLELLGAARVSVEHVVVVPGRPTTTKTRVICGHQQLLRLDRETAQPFDGAAGGALEARLSDWVRTRRPAALVVSDYAKGVVTPGLCAALVAAARAVGVPALVDPKGREFARYAGATALTPNSAELALATGSATEDLGALLAAGQRLQGELGLDFLAVTRGAQGMTLLGPGAAVEHVAAQAREVFDVSGAGDTVIATLAAGLTAGLTPVDAAHLASLAAGIVVGRVGTVPIAREELVDAVRLAVRGPHEHRIVTREGAAALAQRWRRAGETVVFTNGCFDLLHAGHIALLRAARAAGDRLVIGLNSDASVRRLKGPARPLNSQEDRASILASLAVVDAVVVFEEDTPKETILAIRPQVLVKGADYAETEIVGAAEVRSWGGRVVRAPLVPGHSTTSLAARAGREAGGDGGGERR